MIEFSVLIIDDSEIDRYILSRQLKLVGIEKIFEYEDGSEALAFLSAYETNKAQYPDKFPPIVIFLDINMPLVGGFEFLEEYNKIRTSLGYEASVIMMYSSSEHPSEKEKALSYDFVIDFLVKGGFSPNELKAKILKVVENNQ